MQKKALKMIKFKRKYLFITIWFGLIIYASLTPSRKIPDFQLFKHADKVIHFIMYLGFSFLLIPSLVKNSKYRNVYLQSFLLSVALGGCFELIQKFFTLDRSASWLDFLANTIGAIAGIFIYKWFFEKKKIEFYIFKI